METLIRLQNGVSDLDLHNLPMPYKKDTRLIWVNPYYALLFFVIKMLFSYSICCKDSNKLQKILTMEANTMNPDQTAPKGAV